MGDRTAIQWTDATWNPLRGTAGKWHCVRVSEGCRNCYAATMNRRFGGPDYRAGADTPRLDADVLSQPLRWRRPRRVFVCSMTDLFFAGHTNEQIAAVFGVMAAAPQHTFQVLTKRSARMREWFAWLEALPVDTQSGTDYRRDSRVWWCGHHARVQGAPVLMREEVSSKGRRWNGNIIEGTPWPLPNVWIGVSAENLERLDERVPDLLACPAAVRWVSAEPLLGPLAMDLPSAWCREHCPSVTGDRSTVGCSCCPGRMSRALDWIVVGGESGPGARPCDVAWVRDIVRQGREGRVPVFVKQLGARIYDSEWHGDGTPEGSAMSLGHPKGGDPDEWPEDLRVREWPSSGSAA